LANDKTLENLNIKIETLSSTLRNQLSINKTIETQLAQIAASILLLRAGRSRGILRLPLKMSAWCPPDPSRRPPSTNHAGRYNPPKNDSWEGLVAVVQEDPGVMSLGPYLHDVGS